LAWNPESVKSMLQFGIDPFDGYNYDLVRDSDNPATVFEETRATSVIAQGFENRMAFKFQGVPAAYITRSHYLQAARALWDEFCGEPGVVSEIFSPLERMLCLAIEGNTWPYYIVEQLQGRPLVDLQDYSGGGTPNPVFQSYDSWPADQT